MWKKSNFTIFALLLGLTSCRAPTTTSLCYPEAVEIPCAWQSPIGCGVNFDDPYCFLWWDEMQDPMLTSLIENASFRNKEVQIASLESKEKVLSAVNKVSFEVARNYIELRGLQTRLKALEASIESQREIFATNKGLSKTGFVDLREENEAKKNLNPLLVQKSSTELEIKKAIFQLSTLLSYPPGVLHDMLCLTQALPELPCEIPVGLPMDLICLNPTVQVAKKTYTSARNDQTFLEYQRAVLSALENTENALAAFYYELERFHYLEDTRQIKAESYQLENDLYNQGVKDERDVLRARQEYLLEENALIQSRVDLLISYANLYYTIGVGWEVCD